MPEGDSVYRLARRLTHELVGACIDDGEIRAGASAGTRLDGLRITGVDTHGKHLLTALDPGLLLHTHLRMQGSWTITHPGRALPQRLLPQVRVRFRLADGRTVWAVDMPVVELLPASHRRRAVGHLGPDPLRDDWDAGEAERRLATQPTRPLVAALLDQRNLAGLGNLWVNELAFLIGAHPQRPIGEVDLPRLVDRAARALRTSAHHPEQYQVTTGDRRRGERHWVVGRAGRPCKRCGTTVRVVAEVAGDPERRLTWWCPRCQPEG